MKRAKSIFLWCGELAERWRGWLPWSGFVQEFFSKKVRANARITPPNAPKSDFFQNYLKRPYSLAWFRTLPSHGRDTGSNPVKANYLKTLF